MNYNKNPENTAEALAQFIIPASWRRLQPNERLRDGDMFMVRGALGNGDDPEWGNTENVGKLVKDTAIFGPYIRRRPAKRKARK